MSPLNGKYKVGVKPPPERGLAKELSVGRGVVRETVRVPQAQGIPRSHPGPERGTRIIAGHTAALGRLFRLHLALSSTSVLDLTNTRMALERPTTTLASRHWGDKTLNKLGNLVDRMNQKTTLDEFNTPDAGFHVETTSTVHSPFIGSLSPVIRQATRTPIRGAFMAIDDWQVFRNIPYRQHRQIFEVIEKRDRDLATVLIEGYIRTTYQILKLGI